MKSGAQFGRLRRYERFNYAAKHPIMSFRTVRDPKDIHYAVITAFNASMTESDPAYFNIGKIRFQKESNENPQYRNEFGAYLSDIQSISIWNSPIDVYSSDKLLMLVTCSYYQENGRFVLVCRRLREGETPDMIKAAF